MNEIHEIVAGRPRDLDDVKGVVARNKGYGESLALDLVRRLQDVTQ
jgi:hypothetical protein